MCWGVGQAACLVTVVRACAARRDMPPHGQCTRALGGGQVSPRGRRQGAAHADGGGECACGVCVCVCVWMTGVFAWVQDAVDKVCAWARAVMCMRSKRDVWSRAWQAAVVLSCMPVFACVYIYIHTYIYILHIYIYM
jgi:hypothetical protein